MGLSFLFIGWLMLKNLMLMIFMFPTIFLIYRNHACIAVISNHIHSCNMHTDCTLTSAQSTVAYARFAIYENAFNFFGTDRPS